MRKKSVKRPQIRLGTLVWYGMVWYGMVWYGMVRYGMARHGTARYGTEHNGMVLIYNVQGPGNPSSASLPRLQNID